MTKESDLNYEHAIRHLYFMLKDYDERKALHQMINSSPFRLADYKDFHKEFTDNLLEWHNDYLMPSKTAEGEEESEEMIKSYYADAEDEE